MIVLDELRALGALCVANVDTSGFGPKPKPSNEACVYLTWGACERRDLTPPLARDLKQVASSIASRSGRLISAKDALNALSTIQNKRFHRILV